MHHCSGIYDATVVTVSKRWDIALTHVFDNLKEISLDIKLGRFASCISSNVWSTRSFCFATGEIISALLFWSFASGFSLKQFISEYAVAPTAVVIKQRQATNWLVKYVEITGIKQQTLSGDQGLASYFESRRLSGVARIGRTGVLAQGDKDFILDDVACGSRSKCLISCALAGLLSAGLTPEAVTIKLHGLTRLLRKIVYYYGLNCHLNDVCRMRTVKFCTKKLRKIIINPHGLILRKLKGL